jgi:hypothetical protein
MKSNLTKLALGAVALALVSAAPASAETSRHHASTHQTFQSEDYGSATAPVRGQRVTQPYVYGENAKTDPDANIRFELRRDSNLDQE